MIIEAEKFLDTLNRLPNTIKTYGWALEYYFSIAGEELSDQAYESFWSDPQVKGLSNTSKRLISSALMGLYGFCEIGDISRRKKINDHYLRTAHTKPVFFDQEAVETIVIYCSKLRGSLLNLRDRAFVLMLADGGFRISEAVGLTRGDVDFQNARAVVIGKGDQQAFVRLSSRSLKALKQYLDKRQKMDGKTGKPLKSLPLFAQHGRIRRTKAMTADGMRKAIKERMDQAGAHCRIHDFRHYFVTVSLISSGGNLKLAQSLARHKNIITTQRYAHLSDSMLDESYDEIFNRR